MSAAASETNAGLWQEKLLYALSVAGLALRLALRARRGVWEPATAFVLATAVFSSLGILTHPARGPHPPRARRSLGLSRARVLLAPVAVPDRARLPAYPDHLTRGERIRLGEHEVVHEPSGKRL